MIDEEITAEEEREAALLAQALDRGNADSPPEEALEAAALLRYSVDAAPLDPGRCEAILAQVLSEARPLRPEPARGWSWLRWLLPVGGLASAAAIAALLLQSPSGATALPAPDRALLEAQARAAADPDPEAGAALAENMGLHRERVLDALGARYGR